MREHIRVAACSVTLLLVAVVRLVAARAQQTPAAKSSYLSVNEQPSGIASIRSVTLREYA